MAAQMPRLARVLETVLYVDDLARAVAFYEQILGLSCIHTDQRLHAYFLAQLQQRAISLGGLVKIDDRQIGRPNGRGGDVLAANLRDDVHVALHLLHAGGALGVVID